ncbi:MULTISPECIES: SHOCT domain-containing protein [unclassified Mammaliicoccus]|uniref:SHOCT domain-containing protein n=1 Tax=unclassified Mammaliicoccus TaxID=2803851 RepID=UPI001EFA6A4D|nr:MULTISPECIES: SHOCT domain-containing protein [unclassified Mammaliicoccus]
MDKYEQLYLESEYNNIEYHFKTNALASVNKEYLNEVGVFLTNEFLILLNKKINKRFIIPTLNDIESKNGVFARKLEMYFDIDDALVSLDFYFKKERQNFSNHLNEIIQFHSNKVEEDREKERLKEEEEQEKERKRKNMPYEELKKLKELYDLDILTEEEYIIKRDELLEDYI